MNGLLLIDKPEGMTSHDVVACLRRLLKIKAIGHCGTLDPMASGLLVMLIGQATKLSDYILSQDKRYRLSLKLGQRTDTLDRTGQIISTCDVNLEDGALLRALEQTVGELNLEIPQFSAKKINGRKLYEYAHKGQKVEAPLKLMRFEGLEILNIGKETAEVEISCSKGSYIRAWVAHIGEALGVGAVLTDLRRMESAPYSVEKALPLQVLIEAQDQVRNKEKEGLVLCEEQWLELMGTSFVPMSEALPGWKSLYVGSWDEKLLQNGQISQEISGRLIADQKAVNLEGVEKGVKIQSQQERRLIGLLQIRPFQPLKIRRVFKT